MSIRIISVVEECKFDVFAFSESHISHDFIIGSDSLTLDVPSVKIEPDCGYVPTITDYNLSPISLPAGFTLEQLITLDPLKGTYRLEKTTNLNLYG